MSGTQRITTVSQLARDRFARDGHLIITLVCMLAEYLVGTVVPQHSDMVSGPVALLYSR